MGTIAEQLVAHPRFTWRVGMVTQHGFAVNEDDMAEHIAAELGPVTARLDINHPATKGHLLAMLREATGDPQATTGKSAHFDTWAAFYGLGDTRALVYLPTEGEALATALLAVWGDP